MTRLEELESWCAQFGETDMLSEHEIQERLLSYLLGELSRYGIARKDKMLEKLRERTETFRHVAQQGHTNWYPAYAQIELYARRKLRQ